MTATPDSDGLRQENHRLQALLVQMGDVLEPQERELEQCKSEKRVLIQMLRSREQGIQQLKQEVDKYKALIDVLRSNNRETQQTAHAVIEAVKQQRVKRCEKWSRLNCRQCCHKGERWNMVRTTAQRPQRTKTPEPMIGWTPIHCKICCARSMVRSQKMAARDATVTMTTSSWMRNILTIFESALSV